jgi:hypothetical protein
MGSSPVMMLHGSSPRIQIPSSHMCWTMIMCSDL